MNEIKFHVAELKKYELILSHSPVSQCSRKNKIKYAIRAELHLINNILHCYMFRFQRDYHRTNHTRHLNHISRRTDVVQIT
jgi:hypothetical protein